MTEKIFKLWIPYAKIMMVPKSIDLIQEEQVSGVTIGQMKQWKYLQFSGMRDKNLNPIFEGDILQIRIASGDLMYIVCQFGTIPRKMDTGWEVEISGFYFLREDGAQCFPISKNYLGGHDRDLMEIVGNIYQQPELFEQKIKT